jgi:hypothetical protein
MSAHTATQIVSIVAVRAADQLAAVAVALTVVSDALTCRWRSTAWSFRRPESSLDLRLAVAI